MVKITQDGKELIDAGQFLTLGNGQISLVLKHVDEQIQVDPQNPVREQPTRS